MCDGSVVTGAPPLQLPFNTLLIPTMPRGGIAAALKQETTAAPASQPPQSSANPNLGKTLDITA